MELYSKILMAKTWLLIIYMYNAYTFLYVLLHTPDIALLYVESFGCPIFMPPKTISFVVVCQICLQALPMSHTCLCVHIRK